MNGEEGKRGRLESFACDDSSEDSTIQGDPGNEVFHLSARGAQCWDTALSLGCSSYFGICQGTAVFWHPEGPHSPSFWTCRPIKKSILISLLQIKDHYDSGWAEIYLFTDYGQGFTEKNLSEEC